MSSAGTGSLHKHPSVSRRGGVAARGRLRVFARTARNHTVVRAAPQRTCGFWRVREGSRGGIGVAISDAYGTGLTTRFAEEMTRGEGRGGDDRVDGDMWRWYGRLNRFAQHLLPSVLVVCLIARRAVCCPRKVDPPTYLRHLMQAMDVARYSRPRPG